jgi:hypothetical protein
MLIKNTSIKSDSGFTIVEVTIALGLSALGGMALLGVSDYFQNARIAIETRATHTQLRNQIFQALSQKISKCTNPANCVVTNLCTSNLQAAAGSLIIPGSKLTSAYNSIGQADNLTLAISAGTTAAGAPLPPFIINGNKQVSVNGKTQLQPTARELADHLMYELYLKGNYAADNGTSTRTFTGAVVLVSHRDLLGRSDFLESEIPVDFTVNSATGALQDCVTRSTERSIAGGLNSVDRCVTSGGTPVPTSLGTLCRFKTPFTISGVTPVCDAGFTGNPITGCTLDPNGNASTTQTIPNCPPFARDPTNPAAFTTDPGTINTTKAQGNLYCDYTAANVAVLVGLCPFDPNDPTTGWNDDPTAIPPTVGTATTNVRHCIYNYLCQTDTPPGTTIILAPPAGDGQTPTCQKPITQCSDPTVWVQTNPPPTGALTCTLSPAVKYGIVPPPAPVVACPTGFMNPAANHIPLTTQDLGWVDPNHVLCM